MSAPSIFTIQSRYIQDFWPFPQVGAHCYFFSIHYTKSLCTGFLTTPSCRGAHCYFFSIYYIQSPYTGLSSMRGMLNFFFQFTIYSHHTQFEHSSHVAEHLEWKVSYPAYLLHKFSYPVYLIHKVSYPAYLYYTNSVTQYI